MKTKTASKFATLATTLALAALITGCAGGNAKKGTADTKETPAPAAKTETKAPAPVEEKPKVAGWDKDGEDWKQKITWPYDVTDLQNEAAKYAKDKYLGTYLENATVRTVVDDDLKTGTVSYDRGAGKAVLNVYFAEGADAVTHYYTRR